MRTQQIPANQLNLFDAVPIDHSRLVTDRAIDLLEMLNEGRKKDKFKIEYSIQQNNFIILIATNVLKEIACNAVDIYGNVPKKLTPNWRHFKHVEQDLKQEYNVTIRF
ncbi:hypothetical protein [Flavobacterium sp. FlaQc-50]|uniref:hypothetical protein n=1 Tax=unclassified Flavobacterium TaxID=196869 RepID=UPI00375826BA